MKCSFKITLSVNEETTKQFKKMFPNINISAWVTEKMQEKLAGHNQEINLINLNSAEKDWYLREFAKIILNQAGE